MRWRLAVLVSLLTMVVTAPLAAQEAPVAPGDLFALASLVVAAALPFATSWIFEGIQVVATGLKSLPPVLKAVLAVVVGYGLAWITFWLGIPLPESIDGLTEKNVFGILEGLAAAGMHYLRSKKKKAPA